LTLRQWLSF
jgi:MerR family regulatory protein